MKKILFSVAVLVYCLLIATSGNSQGTYVPAEVQNSFSNHFKNAKIARWVPIQDSYVASFTEGQGYKDAYFTNDGEFKGVGRFITVDLLPMSAQEKLNSYSNYEIIELYQFDSIENGICFFAVLENQKHRLTVKMDTYGDVSYSKKDRIKEIQKVSETLAVAKEKN